MNVDLLEQSMPGFVPHLDLGVPVMPVFHMRGGTSTGVVLWRQHLPKERALQEELVRHLMGVPLQGEIRGNRQTTGLGRGPATSNKVFIMAPPSDGVQADFESTLAQLASDHDRIDWGVNCGNMSSSIPLYLWQSGLLRSPEQLAALRIWNTNTQKLTLMRMPVPYSMVEIPGVHGRFPEVALSLQNPVGAKTGQLFPTGDRQQMIDGVAVSCLDVAVPMVIVRAADLGCTARETPAELQANRDLMARLQSLWVQAGLQMRLKTTQGQLMSAEQLAQSETMPKICMVAPGDENQDLHVRYFTPQSAHASLAVTGGCCLAVATLIDGTVAFDVANTGKQLASVLQEQVVRMGNPAGILQASVYGQKTGQDIEIPWVSYQRSAQVLAHGFTPIYQASEALTQHFQTYQA